MPTATALCSICGYRIEAGQTGVLDVGGGLHHLRCEPPLTCAGCGSAIVASDAFRREGTELLHAQCESTSATDRRRRSVIRIRIEAGVLRRDCPPDASVGYSHSGGSTCDACGETIAAGAPEYVTQPLARMRLHVLCYVAWREQSDRIRRAPSILFERPVWTSPEISDLLLAAGAAAWRAAREAVQVSRRTRARSAELRGGARQLILALHQRYGSHQNGAAETQRRNPVV